MLVDKSDKHMQKGEQTDLILFDFSKAFDKVAHEKLLKNLHHYGTKGDTLNLIQEFKDNQKQTVVINELTQIKSQSHLASRRVQFSLLFSFLHT